MRRAIAFCAGCLGLAGCAGERPGKAGATAGSAASDVFVEVASSTGLDFVHFNGMSGERYLDEITCGGAALFDFDNDGDLDAYLLQGKMLGEGKTLSDALVPPRHPTLAGRLYRNELAGPAGGGARGRLLFTDVTEPAGLRPGAYGCSVATGDYDNDGWVDLYLGNLGRNQMLRNNGDGTFTDTTDATGAGDELSTAAVVFFDYDRDGWLDLAVGNYVDFAHPSPPLCRDLTGAQGYCGPGAYAYQPDRLYRNRGDGTFANTTVESGLAGQRSLPALGLVADDLDGDGWQDLYVANDGEPNDLWINRRDGTFVEEGLPRGAAVNRHGESEASMGVDAGDFDNDGDSDVFMTHLIRETNTLYRNDGTGNFEDATLPSGLGPPSLPFTSFGTGWLDYDNDGWLDLLVVNGAVSLLHALVERRDPFPLHQTKQLFRNRGDGTFADATAEGGAAFELSEVGRGAAFGDVDNDGDTDVLVANNNGPARLLLNQLGHRRRWLGVRLVAGSPPRDQLGARAVLRRSGLPSLTRRVHTDGSYASANDPRVLFGLGDDPRFDALLEIEVRWPDGSSESWSDLPLDTYSTLRQGSGRSLAGERR
jgi:hypothetical protein